jgi:hypothetical protein
MGQEKYRMTIAIGSRKKRAPKISIHACDFGESRDATTSMRTCALRFKVQPAASRKIAE